VFKNDAPDHALWQQWQAQGWTHEARHYLKLGRNVQCKVCPNQCLLEPGDRGHCRNRVNHDGTLFTLAYGNACSMHVDPIEKKPLFHFLPGTEVFSFASSGCGFRCLNCQNWEISQRKPEETKNPQGAPLRLQPDRLHDLSQADFEHVGLFPDDAVALAQRTGCPSIAYTYSEPTAWYEYMLDTARLARQHKLRSAWITCGYVQPEPLAELCQVLDAANVNLKSFDQETYATLNTGKLQPVLDTLVALKRAGVWFEVTNLIVPSYTDRPAMIGQMCRWLVDRLGPDQPLHFSRFHPAHKLLHLPPTPIEILLEARDLARQAGLRYVYLGNVHEVDDAGTTYCPGCRKAVVERQSFAVRSQNLRAGKCAFCGTAIAGVWS
jgi:pyruvate formate lyase activating enzyme